MQLRRTVAVLDHYSASLSLPLYRHHPHLIDRSQIFLRPKHDSPPHKAASLRFFATEESMLEFVRRGRGVRTLEDRNILDRQMRGNRHGDVILDLTDEQYAKLKK
jgi:hypothetical protein